MSNKTSRRSSLRRSKRTKQLGAPYQALEPRQLLAAAPIISEFLASNETGFVNDNGNASDWIEIYNAGDASINLAGYTLTDDAGETDKWTFPSVNLAAGQYLTVIAAVDAAPTTGINLYTGFSLKASGEFLGFYDSAGTAVSEFVIGGSDYPPQYEDVSYGVRFDVGNFDQVSYFETPTPGSPNSGAVDGLVDRVVISQPAGFYDTAFDVTLSSTTPGATIYYTLDGSTPSATNGNIYSAPITISGTSNLRTVATKANYLTVPDRTASYIFIDDVVNQSLDGSAPVGWPATWGANDVDYGIDPDVIATEGLQTIKDSLLSIPTWSVTTDLDNLFDAANGIYANAEERGIAWERPASVELLNPDGSTGFQVNAGLRIKGAYSRRPENPKHSFKIYMRNEYGDSELNFPVHGDEGVDTFKKLDLRTAQNWSWSFNGNNTTQFVEDELARENMKDLGQPYTRSVWFHLYLNGQYWGIFQTQERHDENFAASYFGGDPDDYDVIKARPGTTEAVDGNLEAYERLFDQAAALDADGSTPNFVNQDAYLKAQGLNPDGTRNLNYEVLLDVDNVIDYMTIQLLGGNRDGPIGMYSSPANTGLNNFFTMRDRTGDQGFQFFAHDSEHMLRDVNEDRMGPFNHSNFDQARYFNPHTLHQKLMANEEYRIEFADNVQQHFFNGGTLSAQAQIDKMYELAAEIDTAVYAESARWGDAKVSTPRLRSTWLNRLASLRDNYFHQREAVVLQQFRDAFIQNRDGLGNYTINEDAPLFPWLDAPQYFVDGNEQSGGQFDVGDELQISASDGIIYYTLDGSDPRLLGGGISPDATIFDGTTTDTTVLSAGSVWNYHDQGSNLGSAWRESSYNDSSWSSGNAELGYGDGNEATVVSFGGDANNKHVTTYFRKTVNVAAGDYLTATLQLRRDDGVVVFLNGVEIARDNLPGGTINYDTFASTFASDDGNDWQEFSFDPSLLIAGDNTLAVEIHQISATSSDISFDAELVVSTATGDPIALSDLTLVNARSLAGDGTWSALHSATYFLEAASQSNIRISEINYNPHDPSATEIAAGYNDADDFEFLELANSHPSGTVNLIGMQFASGLTYTFGDVLLGPGERVVVVEDTGAFAERYGTSITPVGEWTGGLSNGGETISLLESDGSEVMSVSWSDSGLWTVAADGEGASLVLDSVTTNSAKLGKHYSWRTSVEYGGTPGAVSASASGVIINEVMAHTDAPMSDSIELFNPTGSDINISGWFLSDSGANPFKYMIPGSTILAAGQYLVFDESDFNPNPTNPGANDFALSSLGDEVYLTRNISGVPAFEDVVEFAATYYGQSVGRLPDGSGRLAHVDSATLGQSNRIHGLSDLIISEVHYNPLPPTGNPVGVGDNDIEFVEIYNRTDQPIDLSQWRLRGDVDFNFPAVTLNPGESIPVLAFDPTDPLSADKLNAFRTDYGISDSVPLLGGFSGDLGNSYGRVSLQQSDDSPLDNPTVTPWVTVDEVVYDDLAPFANADNTGQSLNRTTAASFGNAASSWTATIPTPGSSSIIVASLEGRHVFYNGSTFDGDDPMDGISDNLAIATNKQPLLPGETATFANYTSFEQGINGLFVDIANLESTGVSSSDFEFATGNGSTAGSFTSLTVTPIISVRPGEGIGGSDRVSLILPNGLVTGTWLQVTVKANAATGLSSDDVFYFGNAIGETGDNPANARVDANDIARVRSNLSGFFTVGSESFYDFNRDGRVNATDIGIARNNLSGFFGLNLITAPGGGSNRMGGSSGLFGDDDGGGDIGKFFRYAISMEDRVCRIENVTSAEKDLAFAIPNLFELQDFDTLDRNKKATR